MSMSWIIRTSAAVAAWVAGFIAAPVLACPLCVASSTPGARLGYYVSTGILSLTPLLIMGAGVGYVAIKRSRANREQAEELDLR
jgi:hypothetical protein